MCLNDCVLPEDVLNEAEQASNSLIPEKSKGRYQGGLKLQARTLAVLPHSLVGHSMTYGVTKILKRIRHLK
jgi:hypothetical protein